MFAHYIGMSVAEVSELRSKLKEEEAEMKVAKKTLLKLAAKDTKIPELDDSLLDGPVSLIFSYSDPLSGAQVAFKFGKDHSQVELLGGIFDGKVLTKEEAVELAKMPGREQLLATFASMIRSPLTTFAGMCGSPLGGFARALSELAKQKETEVSEETEETEDKDKEKEKEKEDETEKEEESKEEKPTTEEGTSENTTEESSASSDSSASSSENPEPESE
jgi:large subunit ribosomal protein L10